MSDDRGLSTSTRDLFDDVAFMAGQYGTRHDEQALPGDRIGWQVDIWEHDGDAVWRVTVEAVGS